jgi:arylsulfatase A
MRFLLALLAALAGSPQAAPEGKPNIIHILVDDVGYDDLSCFGAKDVQTPNVDQLAKEGVRLTSFHAPHSTCTPTRAAILTGRYAARVAGCTRVLFPHDKEGLASGKEITIGALLKQQGYATAVVGKWHLGCLPEHLPPNHGFDRFLGIPYPNDHSPLRSGGTGDKGWPPIPLYRQTKVIEQPADLPSLPERFLDEAVAFMTENREKPFFLHMANIETHTPWFVSKKFEKRGKGGRYQDAVECMDWMVGRIVETVKTLGLEKKTLIVFSSDNGPLVQKYDELEKCYGEFAAVDTARAHVLRGGKYQARFDGGTRVAFIARWPGVIPAGRTRDELAAGFDLFTTFARIGGAAVPADRAIDGKDLLPLLKGDPEARPVHRVFFGLGGKQVQSVREGTWKLVLPAGKEKSGLLYALEKDPGEATDLAAQEPDVVKRLTGLAEKAQKAFAAEQPVE